MFQIFLKKQQYGKVSSQFKHHFQQRGERVNFVTSSEHNIQEKLQIFKDLINDGLKPEKKPSIIKSSYFRQDKKLKGNQSCERQIYALGQMTDGFIEWNNAKMQKNKQKQNTLSWSNYKVQKQQRKQHRQNTFGQILKQTMVLKQLKTTHKTQKFQMQIKARLENSILENQKLKPLHLSYRSRPQKDVFILEMYKDKERRRGKLAKYFEEVKEFTCQKKSSSDILNVELRPLNSIQKSVTSTAQCTLFKLHKSGTYAPRQSTSRIKQQLTSQHDAFNDSKLSLISKPQYSHPQPLALATSVSKQQMLILTTQENVQLKNKKSKKLKKMSVNLVEALKANREKQLEVGGVKNVFRTSAKCPFNINKLNAVKKVQCV